MSNQPSPFHEGERAVQARLGVEEIEAWARKVVRDHFPAQHRAFHTALPFLVVAARDEDGRPWATLLEGPDGFVRAPDDQSLEIDALPTEGDALRGALASGNDMGILGIELATRRRNRVNGRIGDVGDRGLIFHVDQTFGNCPQYIREREWHRVENPISGTVMRGNRLSTSQQAWIAGADTFFIASGYRGEGESPTYGMDASHRGGEPGFVEVVDGTRLRFPDYAGNNHYNTIGNLLVDPRAGFLFVDFESGSLLQITGQTSIDWEPKELDRFPGARRLITLDVEDIVELRAAVSLRWTAEADSVRSLRLIEKTRESDDVTSFVFEARDGGPLPDFAAGQHLPLELPIPGLATSAKRTYSLSNAPGEGRYRISVKREPKGLASRFLHDQVDVGAIIDARRPAGEFMLPNSSAPVVLISAGVGVTPMVSMLESLAAEADPRPVWFVHGARDGRHHPLAAEVKAIAAERPEIAVHVAYSRPGPTDREGIDYDSQGRVDGTLLAALVEAPDAHYLLCGPTGFMAQVQSDLERQGVPSDRIHTESFGPAA